jgi:hypothetical protein
MARYRRPLWRARFSLFYRWINIYATAHAEFMKAKMADLLSNLRQKAERFEELQNGFAARITEKGTISRLVLCPFRADHC